MDQELYHHGVKGMRWGIRRYQKKDGSLTFAGKRRYSKYTKDAISELNDTQSRLQSKQRRIATKATKLKSKYDRATTDEDRNRIAKKSEKLGKKYDELEAKNKGIDKTREQLITKKQEQLRKSTDAIDLYRNRDLLTRNEINDRIARISDEARLRELAEKSLPTKKTASQKANDLVEKGMKVYNSPVVQLALKKYGKRNQKEFDLTDFYANINKKTNKEITEVKQRINSQKVIESYLRDSGTLGTHYSGVVSDKKTTEKGKHLVEFFASDKYSGKSSYTDPFADFEDKDWTKY